ncbi:MAG: C40 family peptidase [Oscillospiraceae bacterium]|nr:C40 family peptidase [Oscillospiraceae bacterium]
MSENSQLSKIRLLLITAAIAAGMGAAGTTVFAEDGIISEKDMYIQAVSLYEQLSGAEVIVPQNIIDSCGDESLGKAVMLGFANADEIGSVSDSAALRKQDVMTVLYKTIIDFDDSFALSSDEVDAIMNECYDNALVDEENRAGYAFMLKHRIIDGYYDTKPDKEVTWDGCSTLVSTLYKLFVQNISFNVGGAEIEIGANISTVTDVLGQPARIDKSDYGFDWYIYNIDYNYFMMVGVDADKITAFFSNARTFTFGDIKPGENMSCTASYTADDGFRFFAGPDGTLDGVLYNPNSKNDKIRDLSCEARAFELADIINSYRTNHNLAALDVSAALTDQAADMSVQARYRELARDAAETHDKDGAHHETGYDVFSLYRRFIQDDSEISDKNSKTVGIGVDVDENLNLMGSVIIENGTASDAVATDAAGLEAITPEPEEIVEESIDEAHEAETVETDETTDTADTADIEAGNEDKSEEDTVLKDTDTDFELISPAADSIASADEDLIIQLGKESVNEFLVKIYSYEDDSYIVNSYITPNGDKIEIAKELFEIGKDYKLSISKITDTASSDAQELNFTYGELAEGVLEINSIENEASIDDDHIDLSWDCGLFHDFMIDIYDEEGQLLVSRTISDAHFAKINNIEPGRYFVYVTAVRRNDSAVIKAQDVRAVNIKLPEPVITEYILDDGEEFVPVYEDEEMGLVYFYDEDIIEVTETDNRGRTVTKNKKKITQKQVKATDYYKMLANAQQKVDHFTGSDKPDIITDANGVSIYSYNMPMSIYSSETGNEIVREAQKYLGIPYLWGGTTPNGFDCSGLAQYVYRNCGISISRVSQTQYMEGTPISRENLQPGDLVFFQANGDVHHVGIYVGNGMMIHAPYTGTVIQYQSIDTPYYASQFCGGRRIYTED